jgi:DNA-binding NarL/FixJ family response regulator
LLELEVHMQNVQVAVLGLDPLTVAGLTRHFTSRPGYTVVAGERPEALDVVVAAFDSFSPTGISLLRKAAADFGKPIVLIVDEVKDVELVVTVECRVVAILPRSAATDERLMQCVRSAATDGASIPPTLLGQLIEHTERLHREVLATQGLSSSGLSPREIDVLRLMADGHDTGEIALELSYSERTVKNILYAVTNRLNLRSRPQAVAYAVRAGVI